MKTIQTQKTKAPQQIKGKGKQQATLYVYGMTPSGRFLRAYFIALILAQTGGKLSVGAMFRLWAHANIRGHLASGKIERKDSGFALTVPGYNYFTSPEQEADKELLAKFGAAIRTGKSFDGYKFDMLPLKGAK